MTTSHMPSTTKNIGEEIACKAHKSAQDKSLNICNFFQVTLKWNVSLSHGNVATFSMLHFYMDHFIIFFCLWTFMVV